MLITSVAAFVRPVTDGDFWWHVRTGQWIWEHGRLPGHDIFTYTAANHSWADHEYLTEVLMWLVQARLGLSGVSVAFGLLAWFGLLLVAAAAGARQQPYVIVGLALALGAIAGYPIWGARPQMITFVLASLELLWLRRFLEGSSRAILWLPAVTMLWGNLHGGWPVGLVFLGVGLLGCLASWLRDRTRPEHLRRACLLAIVGTAAALTVLINPNGLAVYAYPLQTLTSAAQRGFIAEWQSPDFHMTAQRAFEVMLLLVLAGMAFGRPTLFDVLVVLVGAVLALEAVRHIALFISAATPVLVATWSDMWRRVALPRFLSAAPRRRWLSAVTVTALALTAVGTSLRTADDLRHQPALTRGTFPVGAADWLATNPEVGTRMFNEYAWGGYLAERFYPEPNRRLFVFSEGLVMGDQLLFSYRQVAGVNPGWRDVLDRAGVDYVVFEAGSPLDEVLRTQLNWRLVYRDATAVIYVRSG